MSWSDDKQTIEGFIHRPVMAEEVVTLLASVPPGVVLDATLGGAGHAAALLEANPELRLVGLDQDPVAVAAGRVRLGVYGARARVVQARFDRFAAILDDLEIGPITGALFDLGVSSPQLDQPARGFSYRMDGPLDMRMDPSSPRSGADVVNQTSEAELTSLFAANGEGRWGRRIARAIVSNRPITTTTQLSELVRSAIPAAARRHGGHPAKRVFQAVRIAVNHELAILPGTLDGVMDRLLPEGRCVVLAYHSGEDRVVKERFVNAATGGCVCPPGLPCVCGAIPTVKLLNRGARRPTADELVRNRRAESARLRAVERLPTGEPR
ncbi:MAG: 16S rRNA (cytosine(1402)-N(4))-methyltransferase RsmH [Actinomycetota bacterium]|nr:16S rRNA (cytosine(1402)-N(4))-methyltransferase RsmH [Actinomycetota bacterium]